MLFTRMSYLRHCLKTGVNSYATAAPPIAAVALGGKAKKKLGKLGGAAEKKVLPVETDAKKLVKFVCGSNINKEGQDIELKPDSEYPEWLWTLNTGKPVPLEQMDPESKEYWYRVRKMAMVQHNKLHKLRRF